MKRSASVITLCLVLLVLALAATAHAAAPTVETFVVDRSIGPYAQPAVDGNLVVWVDFRDDPYGGPSDIWGAVIGPDNQAQAFEVAAAGKTALTGPRVAWTRVVWWSEGDPEERQVAKVWECFVDRSLLKAGAAQLLAEGQQPDVQGNVVVWTQQPLADEDTTVLLSYYTRKRTVRRLIRPVPGVASASLKDSARLSDDLLVWHDEPPASSGRIMATLPATLPWHGVTPPFLVVERGFMHAVDGWTVTYALLNLDYGLMAYDVYVARVDPATLALRTLKLTSAGTSGESDVCRDLVVWAGWTRTPGGSGHEIVGEFIDWSGDTPVAHEFVIDRSGRYAGVPAVTYDALTGRYLVVWTTQAIDDYNDNKIMGAWVTPPASDATEAD